MIYLVKSLDYVKIGYTTDVTKRMSQYRSNNPHIKLLDAKEGDLNDEKELHKQCAKWVYENEWFYDVKEVRDIWSNYNGSNVKVITNLKEQIKKLERKLLDLNCLEHNYKIHMQDYNRILTSDYHKIIRLLNKTYKVLLNKNEENVLSITQDVADFISHLPKLAKLEYIDDRIKDDLEELNTNINKILLK